MFENIFQNQRAILIIVIIGALILAYWLLATNRVTEKFTASPFQSSKELDAYYAGSTVGVEDDLVDNMTCHPSCCGDQWPVPFDNLTSDQVQKCIADKGKPGPFVRTNYTCANGINGVGCPCIRKKPYLFLVNHGSNADTMDQVEPTFLIRNDRIPSPYEQATMTPYETIQSTKSMFVNTPKINDLELQRRPESVSNVKPYNA
jgi:hypothetical protein